MARAPRSRRRKTKTKRSGRAGGGKVRIKGHTRSPRGPSIDPKTGKRKPVVRVKGYRRKQPN